MMLRTCALCDLVDDMGMCPVRVDAISCVRSKCRTMVIATACGIELSGIPLAYHHYAIPKIKKDPCPLVPLVMIIAL